MTKHIHLLLWLTLLTLMIAAIPVAAAEDAQANRRGDTDLVSGDFLFGLNTDHTGSAFMGILDVEMPNAGLDDAYDNSPEYIYIDDFNVQDGGVFSGDATPMPGTNGREFSSGTVTIDNGLQVTMRTYIPDVGSDDYAWSRFLLIMDNPTDQPIVPFIEWEANLGSDGDEIIISTSDGDLELENEDTWLASWDDDTDVPLGFVWNGPQSVVPVNIPRSLQDASGDFEFEMSPTIPASGRSIYMMLQPLGSTPQNVLELTQHLATLPEEVLFNISAEDRARIVNWQRGPQRIHPVDTSTLNADNAAEWPRFRFDHIEGVEWYQVWISSDDYSTTYYHEWLPALTTSPGAPGDSSICDLTPGECFLPMDIWLSNGDYIWWITTWSPGETVDDINNNWSSSTFSVNYDAPFTSFTAQYSNDMLLWNRDINALWYQVWVGPSDYSETAFYEWVPALEICPGEGCIIDFSDNPLPAGEYEAWFEVWGPGGYRTFTDVTSNPSAFTVGE